MKRRQVANLNHRERPILISSQQQILPSLLSLKNGFAAFKIHLQNPEKKKRFSFFFFFYFSPRSFFHKRAILFIYKLFHQIFTYKQDRSSRS
ncbi:hypothetical protein CsatB_013343 [Cannabis sativa]